MAYAQMVKVTWEGWHSGAVVSTVASQQKCSGFGLLGNPCVEFVCSPHAYIGFLRTLLLTAQ